MVVDDLLSLNWMQVEHESKAATEVWNDVVFH